MGYFAGVFINYVPKLNTIFEKQKINNKDNFYQLSIILFLISSCKSMMATNKVLIFLGNNKKVVAKIVKLN